MSPPSATAPRSEPSARPGSSVACASAGPIAASTALAVTVGMNGPGATARPISSATTTSSGRPKPDPPCSSGRCSPSQPSPPSSLQNSGSCSESASSSARLAARAPRALRKSETVFASSRCSSAMAIDMDKQYPLLFGRYNTRDDQETPRGGQQAYAPPPPIHLHD